MLIDLSCLWCDVIIKLKIIEFVCVLLFFKVRREENVRKFRIMKYSIKLWKKCK